MAGSQRGQAIPTQLGFGQFEQFVLPHLSVGSRGPAPKLSLHTLFNYILKLLYLGCQWKELTIEKDDQGREEIHYIGVYRAFRRWEADGCFDAIFEGTVLALHHHDPSFSRSPGSGGETTLLGGLFQPVPNTVRLPGGGPPPRRDRQCGFPGHGPPEAR